MARGFEHATEYFPVSKIRYDLEDFNAKIAQEKWLSRKWGQLMDKYNARHQWERQNKDAIQNLRDISSDPEHVEIPESCRALEVALGVYDELLKKTEYEYKEYEKKHLIQNVRWFLPDEYQLMMLEKEEDRKAVFDGDEGMLKAIEDQIKKVEQEMDQLNTATGARPNKVEKRVGIDIAQAHLEALKNVQIQVQEMRYEYVENFRTFTAEQMLRRLRRMAANGRWQ